MSKATPPPAAEFSRVATHASAKLPACEGCGKAVELTGDDRCLNCGVEYPSNGSQVRPSSSSQVRPGSSSSLRPSPYGGDEDELFVPGFVPDVHSWSPLDVIARRSNAPAPPDILGLFYPGYNHLVSGESEALKTWLALVAAVEELAAGRGVLWVDGDDVGAGALLERLVLLGADDDAISERFAYVVPDEPLTDERRRDVIEVVRARGIRLAVFDGFNPLLVLHGLSPESGSDVEKFYRLIDPIRKQDVATVLTDNVVKSAEARGPWAIGSERKKSKAEVHLGMKALAKFVRGGTGRARIDVYKDRAGHLERPSPGHLELVHDGSSCSWQIVADPSPGTIGEFRPTNLMEKVSRYLEVEDDSRSHNQIADAVSGKGSYKRQAIAALVREGYADEFEGKNRARLVRSLRPYRELEDEAA